MMLTTFLGIGTATTSALSALSTSKAACQRRLRTCENPCSSLLHQLSHEEKSTAYCHPSSSVKSETSGVHLHTRLRPRNFMLSMGGLPSMSFSTSFSVNDAGKRGCLLYDPSNNVHRHCFWPSCGRKGACHSVEKAVYLRCSSHTRTFFSKRLKASSNTLASDKLTSPDTSSNSMPRAATDALLCSRAAAMWLCNMTTKLSRVCPSNAAALRSVILSRIPGLSALSSSDDSLLAVVETRMRCTFGHGMVKVVCMPKIVSEQKHSLAVLT
mmetsp:Transcript_31517/g.69462  ORF Transcript_31517/g.69462 Transcript_31517/m.69462 type:complete len:269 (-) Transcript_31517:412-1218(-)